VWKKLLNQRKGEEKRNPNKMTNSQHLNWLFDRLVEVHNENPNYDYMIRFRKIIDEVEKEETKDLLTRQEKIDFIIKTQTEIMGAIFNGHKSSVEDKFQKDRELMIKYRKELGFI
jgi:hypothetical protein